MKKCWFYTLIFMLLTAYVSFGYVTPVLAEKEKAVPSTSRKNEANSNARTASESLPSPSATTAKSAVTPPAPESTPITASTSGAPPAANAVNDATSSLTQSLAQGTEEEQKARIESLKRLAEALQKLAAQQQAQPKSESKSN